MSNVLSMPTVSAGLFAWMPKGVLCQLWWCLHVSEDLCEHPRHLEGSQLGVHQPVGVELAPKLMGCTGSLCLSLEKPSGLMGTAAI